MTTARRRNKSSRAAATKLVKDIEYILSQLAVVGKEIDLTKRMLEQWQRDAKQLKEQAGKLERETGLSEDKETDTGPEVKEEARDISSEVEENREMPKDWQREVEEFEELAEVWLKEIEALESDQS